MRLAPIAVDVAIMTVMWSGILLFIRRRRAQMPNDPSPREVRGYRLHNTGVIFAAVGVTFFVAWLITDAAGPGWLHVVSAPAALLFIAVGAALAGYAGWLRVT